MKKVTGICCEGGFNLTKFTRKKKRVLQSITEKDRQSGVKDKDLVKHFAEDQLWNIEDDSFGFLSSSKKQTNAQERCIICLESVL